MKLITLAGELPNAAEEGRNDVKKTYNAPSGDIADHETYRAVLCAERSLEKTLQGADANVDPI